MDIFEEQRILIWHMCTITMFYFKIGLFPGNIYQINWFLCKFFNLYPRPAQYFPHCRSPYCLSVYRLSSTIRFWCFNVVSCIYFPKNYRNLWKNANLSIFQHLPPSFSYINVLCGIFCGQDRLDWLACTITMFYFYIGLFSGDI